MTEPDGFLTQSGHGLRATALVLTLLSQGALAAEAVTGQPDAGAELVSVADGEFLYEIYCGMCHGDRGEGYIADNAVALSNPDFLAAASDEFLRSSIANGRPDTPMAAYSSRYGGPLSSLEIDAMVAYIRSWQREPSVDMPTAPIVGDAAAALGDFSAHCASCHGEEGQGVTAVSLNNPEFLAAASDRQIRYAIAKGRRGTPMVGFGTRLEAPAIDNLVALIRSWQVAVSAPAVAPLSAGTEGVVLNPDGPAPEFDLRDGRYVSAAQLDAAMRDGARLVLLDARPTSDWRYKRIPGAVSAPHYDALSVIDLLPDEDTWIVSYCACPHKLSDQLTDTLRDAGFANTAVLDEGVLWWEQNGYPIQRAAER